MTSRTIALIIALPVLASVLVFALMSYGPSNLSPATANPTHSGQTPSKMVHKSAAPDNSERIGGVADDSANTMNDSNDDEKNDASVDENDQAGNDSVGDASTSENGPYSASDRPDWEDIKNLPVGEPRSPEPPVYKSNLADEKWRIHDVSPDVDYRQKQTKLMWGTEAEGEPRRVVRGRVFEIIGKERIPLSGVLVVGGWNRTFTDSEGRFEFLSTFWEPSDDDKKHGQKFRYELFARAHGYVDFRGRHTYSNLDETDEGVELYLVRRDSRLIRISFENPQAAGRPVTVVLARNDYGGLSRPGFTIDWDEKRYIIAEVDPHDETWFSVPLRYYHAANETRFALRSVFAPNILADIKTLSPISETGPMESRQEAAYRVRLTVEDTVAISGTATDMQTGKPIPHARVYGPGTTEFTVADDQGQFELITSKTPRGPRGEPIPEDERRYLYVSDERYATMTIEIKDSSLHADGTGKLVLGPGGSLSGPWTFQLRRWVEATVDCTFLPSESRSHATIEIMYDVVDGLTGDLLREVDPDGFCRFPRIPWGTEKLRLATRVPFAAKEHDVVRTSWEGDEPYRLAVPG